MSTGGKWADGGNFWRGPATAQGYICQFGGGSVQGGKIKTDSQQQFCELYDTNLAWVDGGLIINIMSYYTSLLHTYIHVCLVSEFLNNYVARYCCVSTLRPH